MRVSAFIRILPALIALAACAQSEPKPLMSAKSPVELRAMQSRAFDTADRALTLRQVIATLQDLGYSLDKVEASAGTVSATKLAVLRMTASVIPHGSATTVVRANAMVTVVNQRHQVDDPRFYQQNFFSPLAGAMLLEALPDPALEEADSPASRAPSAAKPPEAVTPSPGA